MQIQKCLYSTIYDSIRSSTNKLKGVEGEFGEAGKILNGTCYECYLFVSVLYLIPVIRKVNSGQKGALCLPPGVSLSLKIIS